MNQSNENRETETSIDKSMSIVVNERLSSIYDGITTLTNEVYELSKTNKPEAKSRIENVQFNEESHELLNNTWSCIFEDEEFKAKIRVNKSM